MALETVQVTVLDETDTEVDDVVVRVYDSTGTTLITSGTTGTVTPGLVEFTLDGDVVPTQYRLRFFISGGSIVSPQFIEVYSPAAGSPTGTNNFEIAAELFVLPTAVDATLCRCSGYVRGPNGLPRKGVDIHFIPAFNPLVVNDQVVLGERVSVRTDADGYVSTDLFRNGYYVAMVESHENVQREIAVPDRSSVNIAHLLFPIVTGIVWDPVGPWSLNIGDDLEVTPEITASSFLVLEGTAVEDVHYTIDDPEIASVVIAAGTITIHGNDSGSTKLRVTRADTSVVYTPDPGIDGDEVDITVV